MLGVSIPPLSNPRLGTVPNVETLEPGTCSCASPFGVLAKDANVGSISKVNLFLSPVSTSGKGQAQAQAQATRRDGCREFLTLNLAEGYTTSPVPKTSFAIYSWRTVSATHCDCHLRPLPNATFRPRCH